MSEVLLMRLLRGNDIVRGRSGGLLLSVDFILVVGLSNGLSDVETRFLSVLSSFFPV